MMIHLFRTPAVFVAVILISLIAFPFASIGQTNRLLGLDISAWQLNISQTTWNNIRTNENRHFIVLRSSRGGTTGYYNQNDSDNSDGLNTLSQRYDDPYFVQNINRVPIAGMYAGSYHFSRPDIIATTTNSGGIPNSGSDEADHFIQMAGPWMRPGYLLPIHDLEAGDGIRTDNEMAQFAIDFSNRIYERMGIRPGIYINGNYAANILQTASVSLRDQLAKPATNPPSMTVPCYPLLWVARWPNQTNVPSIDVQGTEPKDTYSGFYGPWDDYGGSTHPWQIWQYASTGRLPSFMSGTANLDFNVIRGGIEFLRDQLVPAVWSHNASGQWTTLTNWNSGLTPVAPVTGPGQVAPVGTQTLPTPRLPGASGSGTTSGQYDTVILDRPTNNITVTITNGTHNIRKLYMRETLDITGGSFTVNYAPAVDSTTNGAEFSGNASLSGSASFSVHTLQVDAPFVFALNGGTLTLNRINLMPGGTPGRLSIGGNININPLTNSSAAISAILGASPPGFIDLAGGNRTLTLGNGTAEFDLNINTSITNGALTKSGPGTLVLSSTSSYAGGTTLTDGRLLINSTGASGSGTVAVNGGFLGGTGIISGAVTVNSTGTIAPGSASIIGKLRINSSPTLIGTNFSRVDRNGGSSISDQLSLTGGTMTPLTYGGTLVISNAGAALVGGEVFTNFSANAYAGSFTATILPSLSAGLNWNLNRLTTDGTIRVNRAPSTGTDLFNASTGVGLLIPIANLLTNDTDIDGDTVSISGIVLTSTNGITLTTNATSIFYTNNLAGSDRINYSIHDSNGGVSTGAVLITITVANFPPSVTQQPTNLVVIAASPATFNVTTSGSEPLVYQWRFNGANIGGATAATLSIPSAQTNDAGDYSVVITNSLGAVTSAVATLSVNFSLTTTTSGGGSISPSPNPSGYPPGSLVVLTATPNVGHTFTGWGGSETGAANPLNVILTSNKSVTAAFLNTNVDLYIDNTNSEVSFVGTWQTGTSSPDKYLSDYRFASTAVGGTITATFQPNLPSPGYYDIYTWHSIGGNRATNAPWTITHSAGSTNIAVDQTINGGNWRLLAASLPFTAGTNGFVRLSNDVGYVGKVVMADGVRFQFVSPLDVSPSISIQPLNQTVKAGSNVLFSIIASGAPAPEYQWQFNNSPISGATASTYIRSNAQFSAAGNYSVIVSNTSGAIISSNATLTVLPLSPMWIQSITPLLDGRMSLIVTGEPGYAYSVDRSTDLSTWQQITNLHNTNGTSAFTDDAATNSGTGFYRTRQ